MRLERTNIEANTSVNKPEKKVSKTQKKTEEVTVPIIEENKEKTSNGAIEGYYIEKTTPDTKTDLDPAENDDDDTIDTNVHPEDRLTLSPSISLNIISNKLTNTLEQAVNRASNSGVDSGDKTDRFFTQGKMLTETNDYNDIFKLNFEKRFNAYGKGIYQYTNYKQTDTDANIHMAENSQKLEFGGAYSSKSGNTKIIFLGSATRTHIHDIEIKTQKDTSTNTQESSSNSTDNPSEETTTTAKEEITNESKGVFNGYLAGQHTFRNNDILTANVFFNHDEVESANTTEIKANYYLNKFKANVSAETTIYNGSENVHTVKTNIKCAFNPESQEGSDTKNNNTETNTTDSENTTTPNSTQQTDPILYNKWKVAYSPFLDTQIIEGYPEEGLGMQVRLKNIKKDSSTRLYGFGKFSTTQRGNESSYYHITTGVGAKYTKSVGKNSALKANADIKDKVTFGYGNIFTVTGNLCYVAPKVSAEIEGKYIRIPNSYYTGVVGKVSYTPRKNIHTYAEGSYLDWKYPEGRLKGGSFNIGALISF